MTHDTTLKYIIILSQGHLEGYHVIFFHPLRLVNIHLILGHVQETQADWFHSKKCKKQLVWWTQKFTQLTVTILSTCWKKIFWNFMLHSSFMIKNWQNQLCINYLPKYMSLVHIPSILFDASNTRKWLQGSKTHLLKQ